MLDTHLPAIAERRLPLRKNTQYTYIYISRLGNK